MINTEMRWHKKIFNIGKELMDYIVRYKKRFGFYPKEVGVDKLYTSRETRKKLKGNISGIYSEMPTFRVVNDKLSFVRL